MKKCPYCAEEIQEDAKKCRYCGEFLHTQQEENNNVTDIETMKEKNLTLQENTSKDPKGDTFYNIDNLINFYCPFCKHFDTSGVCGKLHTNIVQYPIKFIKKCNTQHFNDRGKLHNLFIVDSSRFGNIGADESEKKEDSTQTSKNSFSTIIWIVIAFILMSIFFIAGPGIAGFAFIIGLFILGRIGYKIAINKNKNFKKEPLKIYLSTYRDETLGIIGLAIPIISTIIVTGWIEGMRVTIFNIDLPSRILATVTGLGLILTALILSIEASKIKMGSEMDIKPNGKRYANPVEWFFAFILLLIVAYPWYFARRARYGLKNYSGPAMLIVLISIISVFYLNYEIDNAKKELKYNLEQVDDYLK